jgi:phage baseplate assembly protein gpV
MRPSSWHSRAAALLALALWATQPALASQAAKQQPHRHVVTGDITAYDKDSHTLTIKTPKGQTTFVCADAKVYLDSKSVELDEVSGQLGSSASVTYALKGGQRVASSVRITPHHAAKKG